MAPEAVVALLVPGVPVLLMLFLVVMERLEALVLPAPGPARPERVMPPAAGRRTVPGPEHRGTGPARAAVREVVEEPVERASARA